MKTIIHRSIAMLLALLLALGPLGLAQVQAAPSATLTCIWTGAGSDANWSTQANWMTPDLHPGCAGLANGATAILGFWADASRKTNYNNLTGLHVVSLGLEASGYDIDGNQVVLAPAVDPYDGLGTSATTGSSVLRFAIQLAGSIKVKVPNALAGLHLTGAISGAYGITKTGSGALNLDANSSFSGGVTVSAGEAIVSQSQAGGSGTIEVQDGSALTVASTVSSLSNPLALSGSGGGGSGALHFDGTYLYLYGPLTLAAAATLQNTAGTLTLANAIGGTGPLTLDGPAFILSGYNANTFTGGLILPHGVLTLNHPAGVTAVPGNLSLGPGNAPATAQVLAMAEDQFSFASQVTLGKNTVLNLQGHSQTIRGMVAPDRPCLVELGGGQTTTLTFDTISGPQNYVNCDVSGTGTLLVKGDHGNQSFRNNDPANPFNGSLDVQGTAASYLKAFHMTGAYYLHSNTGGGLSSSSTVGSLLADNAWMSIELHEPSNQSQAGSLLLSGTALDAVFELMALDARGLKVAGPVSLGSATLFVCYFAGFEPGLANTPANPSRRTLVQNDAASAVTGIFDGLPEGSQTSMNRCLSSEGVYPARITYQGGDGNDVVVTRLIEDTLALQVFPIPTFSNQAVTLQAVLSAADNPAGAVPGQKAAFYDGDQRIGEAAFTGLTALLPGVRFAGGSHSLQARLVGDPNFADASSEPANFTIKAMVFIPVVKK